MNAKTPRRQDAKTKIADPQMERIFRIAGAVIPNPAHRVHLWINGLDAWLGVLTSRRLGVKAQLNQRGVR